MDIFTLILLSISLAMDCFAVSVARAAISKKLVWGGILFTAFMFGLFQGGMPLLGFYIGFEFIDQIREYDHWIALAILTMIGGKMIYDDLKHDFHPGDSDYDDVDSNNPYSIPVVLLLSVATSIDALATGFVFLSYPESIFDGVIIICIGSFVMSILGSLLGHYIGKSINFKFNLIAGVILILIGVKIVVEHCCM